MRLWGLVLIAGGLFAFFYGTTRLEGLAPVPPEVPLGDYLRYEAGKWELCRYGGALAGLIGALFALFPKGK